MITSASSWRRAAARSIAPHPCVHLDKWVNDVLQDQSRAYDLTCHTGRLRRGGAWRAVGERTEELSTHTVGHRPKISNRDHFFWVQLVQNPGSYGFQPSCANAEISQIIPKTQISQIIIKVRLVSRISQMIQMTTGGTGAMFAIQSLGFLLLLPGSCWGFQHCKHLAVWMCDLLCLGLAMFSALVNGQTGEPCLVDQPPAATTLFTTTPPPPPPMTCKLGQNLEKCA